MSDCSSQIINGFRPCACDCTPLNITELYFNGFTDPSGNIDPNLVSIVIGDQTYPITQVGRIEGTHWIVFGIRQL